MSNVLQEIVCGMGAPAGGNPTQFAIEKAFAAAGLEDWRFITAEVQEPHLADALRGARAMGFRGVSLASPHRAAALPWLDAVSELAAAAGSVDCVVRVGERLHGDNLLGRACLHALPNGGSPAGKRVVIFGAGLMGAAIAAEAVAADAAEVLLVNRNSERAERLAQRLIDWKNIPVRTAPWDAANHAEHADLVVNATSAGDDDGTLALSLANLRSDAAAVDVRERMPHPAWLREAAQRGCRVADGVAVVLARTGLAFRVWTGIEPNWEVLRDAIEEYLEA